jgi:DNA-binding transcriptional MerR regulator
MAEMAIGSFSRACGLTVGALRHYDDLGLLRPIRVDTRTGYRYYGPEQVLAARIIARLRSFDVPLDEIRSALVAPGQDAVRERLRAHRAALEARTWQLQRTMHRLQQIIEDKEDLMSKAVSLVLDPEEERSVAKQLFNDVWTLLERPDRTPDDDDTMLHAAHASRYHWGQVGLPVNLVRGEWQCSRVYAVLGRAEPAAYHARRCLELCEGHAIRGFDRGFAYEALARAAKVAGDHAEARRLADLARTEARDVKEDEDRKLLLDDLASL